MLVLGHQSDGSENLNIRKLHSRIPLILCHIFDVPLPSIEQPLASGFSLRDGSVRVTCPTVSPGNNYIVVCKHVFLPKLTFV